MSTKLIHNAETGEVKEIELTELEIIEGQERLAAKLERLENEKKVAIQKAALLEKLGITANEAKLLLS